MDLFKKYTKTLSKTVDQSQVVMPPVWSNSSINNNKSLSEIQNDLFISGRNRELANYLIQLISEAKHSAILSSFLLADEQLEDAIDEAALRGVNIYIMLACETRLEGDTPDDDFGKQCLDQHKYMLNRLAGKVLIRSAPHFHSKMVIVDALNSNHPQEAKGVLLTSNLTSEALERNEELAIRLNEAEIQEAVQVIKWAMFEYAEHQMQNNHEFSAVKKQNTVAFPQNLKQIVYTTHEHHSIRDSVLKLINESSKELYISSFGWQEDHSVINAICNKARQGVKVTILCRNRFNSMPALTKLSEAGAAVYGFKWLHAKAIWNDRNEGMIMSANLEQHGLDTGFELGVLLHEERADQLRFCLQSLLLKADSDIMHLIHSSKLGEHSGSISFWENKRLTPTTINQMTTERLEDIKVDCLTKLNQKIKLPELNWKNTPSHSVTYTWNVLPPELPVNSKEQFWDEKVEILPPNPVKEGKGDKRNAVQKPKMKTVKKSYFPKVYRSGKETFIAIANDKDFEPAKKLRTTSFPHAHIVLQKQG